MESTDDVNVLIGCTMHCLRRSAVVYVAAPAGERGMCNTHDYSTVKERAFWYNV